MYLIDTNIFLEILLQQEKSEQCKSFLNNNIKLLCISDFSFHSIGVILFRQNKIQTFQFFIQEIIPLVTILSLPQNSYSALIDIKQNLSLDFDDAYQYAICKSFYCDLVTMDNDFRKIDDIKIEYL